MQAAAAAKIQVMTWVAVQGGGILPNGATPLPEGLLPEQSVARPPGRDTARPVHQGWHPVPSFPGRLLG